MLMQPLLTTLRYVVVIITYNDVILNFLSHDIHPEI